MDGNINWAIILCEAQAGRCTDDGVPILYAAISPPDANGQYTVFRKLKDGSNEIARYIGSGWVGIAREPDWARIFISASDFSEDEISSAEQFIQTG